MPDHDNANDQAVGEGSVRPEIQALCAEIRDLTDVVATFWPYDGPHNVESVTSAAYGAARLYRYVANATQPHQGALEFPSTVDSIVGNAAAVIECLKQVLGQLGLGMHRFAEDPRLFDDRGGQRAGHGMGPEVAIKAAAALAAAQGQAHQLGKALAEVTRYTTHLGLAEEEPAEPVEVEQ